MANNSKYNDLINESASDWEKNHIMDVIDDMKQIGFTPNKIKEIIHTARITTNKKLARNKLIFPNRKGMSSYKPFPKGGSRRSTKRSNRKNKKTRKH